MVILFPWFVKLVGFISITLGAGPVDETVGGTVVNINRYIANGHTIFNVINATFFLIFLPKLIQAAIYLSPKEKTSKERYRLPEFDTNMIDSTIGALAKVRGEVNKMAEFTRMNLNKVCECIEVRDDDKLAERQSVEDHIDAMQKIIIKYLTTIYQGDVNESDAREISEMMRITNNIERIGDSIENISKLLERIYDEKISLSKNAVKELNAISGEADRFFNLVITAMNEKPENFYETAAKQEALIDQMREDMRQGHIDRLRENRCSVDAGVLFIALLSNFEKIGDYCFNIAIGVSRIQ